MSKALETQANNALDFVQKLYFEISYLIKEVEGVLQQQEEEFIIVRPSGYGVTTRTSIGLEPVNVDLWLSKAFTVFFCSKDNISEERGQTKTSFSDDLKVLILDIELMGKLIDAPRILAGCLRNISCKKPTKYKKFEAITWEFAYSREKIFSSIPNVSYEDSYVSFTGKFKTIPLFSINDSEAVERMLVDPMVKLFRS